MEQECDRQKLIPEDNEALFRFDFAATEAQMQQDCAALQLSHLPMPHANRLSAAATHPILRGFALLSS